MRAPALAHLAFASLVVVPWNGASAEDAPPPPPPAPREASDGKPRDRVEAHPIPGIQFVPRKANPAWLARWIRQPGEYRAHSAMPGFFVTSLPPGIVPIGDLPSRIAAARAAGREQEAVTLQAALDALSREQAGTDAASRIVWIGAGETLRGERLTVDEQELPPGKYAVVRRELGPRTLRVTGGSRVTITGAGTRYETITPAGDRTIHYIEASDRQGTSLGGTRVEVPTHPPILPGTPGQPFTVTRNADGTNTITFTTAPGPTRPGPGLSTAIEDLRGEIRALRDEIRALRAVLEGSPAPK